MEPIKVIVIGAGDRGRTYTNIMKQHPDKFKVIGVAEPIVSRRESVKNPRYSRRKLLRYLGAYFG